MCQIVTITNRNNIELGTPRQLLKEIPDIELINSDPEIYESIDLDNCLCQLDLEQMFDNAGINWKDGECMEYIVNI